MMAAVILAELQKSEEFTVGTPITKETLSHIEPLLLYLILNYTEHYLQLSRNPPKTEMICLQPEWACPQKMDTNEECVSSFLDW